MLPTADSPIFGQQRSSGAATTATATTTTTTRPLQNTEVNGKKGQKMNAFCTKKKEKFSSLLTSFMFHLSVY